MNYRWSQIKVALVTQSNKKLQEVTQSYTKLHKVTWGYIKLRLKIHWNISENGGKS